MDVVIKNVSNVNTGVDIRAIINTNFENIKNALGGIDVSGITTIIYTDIEITSIEDYVEGTVQIICNSTGVKIKKLVDGEWCLICEYTSTSSGLITLELAESGIGYPLINTDDSLDGMPVGYINGSKVVAGTQIDGGEPVNAVGWYKSGQLTKTGRIQLDQELVAGTPVWVLNGGGWTIEKPTETGKIGQVIGFVSDDGLYIDIDIQPWVIIS